MNSAEKRKHTRKRSINLSYICLDKEDNVLQQAMGKTINISEGGFLLETHFPLTASHTLVASIGLKDDLIELKGEVVHCEALGGGKYVAGIQIMSIEGAGQAVWSRYIDQISGDSALTDTDR